MRRLTFILFLLTNIFFPIAVSAQAAEIVPAQKEAVEEGKIFTAIDAAEALLTGSSDAALAALLSDRRGIDRRSLPTQGYTDEQLIIFLLTDTASVRNELDENVSMRHLIKGNTYSQEARYDQAAREYTLAVKFSPMNYMPYKSRAVAYLQYLRAKNRSWLKNVDPAQQKLFHRVSTLLCNAISSDYEQALALNDAVRNNNSAYLLSKKGRLGEKDMGNDPISYNEKSKRTNDTLLMRRIYQSQRNTLQTDREIRKSMEDCRAVCDMKEEAAR